ncbi:MAG: zinc dependent phospholipase C family protein [Clostridia bacterium]|nr:zinc dependent phospholipase C family protein [Clostridia bacterium]
MPTTYAHWRFAKDALEGLPADLKETALRFRALYDIGAQGPDVFFHYKCLHSNEVTRFGYRLHETPMREILLRFRQNFLRMEDREAALAYLLGFLSHFTLDSYCHGYIERKAQAEGPSHDKIESQYDRHLLLLDGRNPYKTRGTFSLQPTPENARVMARLYGPFDEKIMRKSVSDQIFYRAASKDSSAVKRAVLTVAMKAAGAGSFLDMMMGPDELPQCVPSNLRLDKYAVRAAEHYPLLAANMAAFLREEEELLPYFGHDFGPKADWESIPLLSAEEEKDYRAGLQS